MIGNTNAATADGRAAWFWLLDGQGEPLTGEAANITVHLRRADALTTGTGTITEPIATLCPGLYRYDPASAERTAGQGLLIAEHAVQMSPAPAWPFVLVAGDVTDAPTTEEAVAAATAAALTDRFSALSNQVDLTATPADVTSAVAAIQAVTDALSVTDGTVAASLPSGAQDEIATALLDLAGAIDGKSLRETLRLLAAFYFGPATGLNTTAPTFSAMGGGKVRITGSVSESTRTVTLDPS